MKKTTMKDIAAAAGVSQSTVSLILNKKYASFPKETIQRVLNTAAELNYNMNKTPSSTSTLNTILVVAVQATNPYYAELLQSIEKKAVADNILVVAAYTYRNPETEEEVLRYAISQKLLGIIFLYLPENEAAYENASAKLPIIVVCDRSGSMYRDVIALNNFNAGVLAANHLLSLGHEKIAVLSHRADKSSSAAPTRISGVLSRIKEVLPDENLLVLVGSNSNSNYLYEDSFHYHTGYRLAQNKKIFQNGITGIICVNDLLAYGVMDSLVEKGYSIPKDFSIIGSDNILYSSLCGVSLTTIEHYPQIVAESAYSVLLMRAKSVFLTYSAAPKLEVTCQPTLIIRNSTGPISGSAE